MFGEGAWYDFNFLKFTEVWFVTQDVVYPGECSVYTWEGVFFCIWMEILKISMRSILSNVLFKTLCDPIDGSPPGSPLPGILQARTLDSPGKNTGVGCHCLLQCVKVKSESEVAQSCGTLSDPMDCSLPGSSIHGIFQARVLEWGAIAFSNVYATSLLTQFLELSECNHTL